MPREKKNVLNPGSSLGGLSTHITKLFTMFSEPEARVDWANHWYILFREVERALRILPLHKDH